METIFLKGRFLKIIKGHCTCGDTSRDTLIAVSDIARIRACKVDIVDGPYATSNSRTKGTESAFVITAIARSNYGRDEDGNDYYMLTDSIDTIAAGLHREVEDLTSMMLQLEVDGNS